MRRWQWLCLAALGVASCVLPGAQIVDSLDGDAAGAGAGAGGSPETAHAGRSSTNAGASGKGFTAAGSGGDAGREMSAAGTPSGGNTSAGSPSGGNTSAGAPTGGNTSAGAPAGGAPAGGAGSGGAPSGGAGSGGTSGSGPLASAGCGKALPTQVTLGTWSLMADQDAGSGKPAPVVVPCTVDPSGKAIPPCVNNFTNRGYSVFVKAGFDNTKPSKVIFDAAACGDTSTWHGSNSGYPYQTVDANSAVQVIQVGIEYSRNDQCYDNSNPASNDFQFFPILHKLIEDQFCVNKDLEYFAGYSSGAWVANQMTCAFPDVLHGVAEATGSEPSAQPGCVTSSHPIASFFLHDVADPYNTYASALPACTRALKQNKCTTTACTPSDLTTSTAYVPATGTTYPTSLSCVQFNGCPVAAPVVFCSTSIGGGGTAASYIGASWPTSLLWDFMNRY